MSGPDDIVTRLRVKDDVYTEFWQQKLMDEAADEIERLRAEVARKADYAERMDALAEERLMAFNAERAVIAAIDALHRGLYHCNECDCEWPCPTRLLIHPMTLDEAIDTLGTVHK